MNIKNKGLKILGQIIVFAIIINGGYIFYRLISKKKPIETYTQKDIKDFYEKCVIQAKVTKYYPEISKANCNCLTNEITNKFTKEEWLAIDSMPAVKKKEILKDIIAKCAHLSGRDTIHVLNR